MQSIPPLATIDGKYDLLRRLGEGGMGTVYEARNRGTGRRVAIKVIASDALSKNPEVLSRFQREALATGAIESQYIAHVLDTGVDAASGSPYMVMDLLSGEDLEQAIKRLGPLAPELVLRIAAQACLGLQKAHEAGVVHRDIKPANIYLATRDGGEIVTKVLDFGIAKVRMEESFGEPREARGLTRTGAMLGTPLYMSPEQALAKKTIDHRTDLFSLGAVLYETLAGATPHAHCESVGELIVSVCSQPARPIQELAPWVGPEVAAIVHRALAMDPSARFQTAEEMHRAIAALLPGGHWMNVSMFAPLPTEVRTVIAPHHSIPGALRAPAPSSLGGSSPGTLPAAPLFAAAQGRTTAGVANVTENPAPPVSPRALIGGFLVLGLAIGAVVVAVSGRPTAAPASSAASAGTVTAIASIAPPPVPPPAPSIAPLATSQAVPAVTKPRAAPAAPKSAAAAAPSAATPSWAAPVASFVPAAIPTPSFETPAAPNCSPPYTVDRRGHMHAKPECSPKGAR